MRRWLKIVLSQVVVAVVAVGLSVALGGVLIALRGHSPLEVYGVLFEEALGRPSGLAQVSFKATTLVFTGIAAAFAFRAGMFNVGGEGQLYLGAFAGALLGIFLPPGWPAPVAVPVIALACFVGGALAVLLPAVLKAVRGTHEVINTIMMNFIVIAIVNWLLRFVRESPEVVRTASVPSPWRLPLFVRGFDGNASIFIAFLSCASVFYLLKRTRVGYELRAVGLSPRAAEYGGVSIARATVLSLLVSGGLAGLGGINFVLGSPGYFEQHFAPFQGFLGIAVALLARNNPIGVVPAAFLFAVMSEGSQSIQEFVPKELGSILQAIVVVLVILASRVMERTLAAWRKGAHA